MKNLFLIPLFALLALTQTRAQDEEQSSPPEYEAESQESSYEQQQPPEVNQEYNPPQTDYVPGPIHEPPSAGEVYRIPRPQRRRLEGSNRNAPNLRGEASAQLDGSRAPSQGMIKSRVTGSMTIDYVNEPILDVLRAIAMAYKLSIIPDPEIGELRVTLHLENVPVLEGLEKLVRSHGLELIEDGNVYRITKASEHTMSKMQMQSKRLSLDVKNKPVLEFLRDFSEKTGVNVLPGQNLQGTVTGKLQEVLPMDGLKALMEANKFEVRLKKGVYIVEAKDDSSPERHVPPRGGRGMGYGSGNMEIDVQDRRVTLNLSNSPLAEVIREIAQQAGVNYVFIGEIVGNANAQIQNATVDDALVSLLQGTRYAYTNRAGTLLIGDRNPNTPSGQALSGAELYFLKYIKAENIEQVFPKSIPVENIKVIREQNAVLITGTGEDISLIRAYLEQIDLPTLQVLMEVIVVEYVRGRGSDLGIGSGPAPYATGPNVQAEVAASGLRGVFREGGFTGTIGVLPQNFDLNLRALESQNKAKILSMPKITTLNGNKAELRVSKTSYYLVSSVSKDGFENKDYRAIDDGITIELTPWVTNHGEVNVSIAPSIKTQTKGSNEGPPPITNRSINTNVSLMDGQTLALGGIINSKEDVQRTFVPILGSIPILGYLFSYSGKTRETTELVIYVTPHVLRRETMGTNLTEDLKALEKRSGRLKDNDFLRSTIERQGEKVEKTNPVIPEEKTPDP